MSLLSSWWDKKVGGGNLYGSLGLKKVAKPLVEKLIEPLIVKPLITPILESLNPEAKPPALLSPSTPPVPTQPPSTIVEHARPTIIRETAQAKKAIRKKKLGRATTIFGGGQTYMRPSLLQLMNTGKPKTLLGE